MGDLLVAWVHNTESVSYSWFQSIHELTMHQIVEHPDTFGGVLPIRYGTGGLPEARNTAAAKFLASDCEWLLWVDTDMGFGPTAAAELLAAANAERPVVGALCFVNGEVSRDGYGGYITRPYPTIYRWARNPNGDTGFVPDLHYKRDELVKCDATGSAFVLVHRSVFEKVHAKCGPNWYTPILEPNSGRPFSEDMSFCIRLVEVGVPVHVHTGVRTTHLKPVWLQESHLDDWLAAHPEPSPFPA